MTGRPRRVLQVVGAMNRGGVESWLMHVLRRVDPRVLQMDFLVHTQTPAAYDREIAAAGSRLIPCGVSWRSPAYGSTVRTLLREFGPYDAVHSHVHHFSGFLLAIARSMNIPVRIAHSHTDTSQQDFAASWLRRQYLRFADTRIGRHATHWLAVSQCAGRALFGPRWCEDRRSRVLHCGIDLRPFRRLPLRQQVRERLSIAPGEFVMGHVGRLDTPKNHPFLLQVAAEAARRVPGLRLMLVGDGPARRSIEQQVETLGLSSRTLFLGSRADVPELLPAMDVFVFPSLWEGLPLTVIEAQAAALRCLISDVISPETVVAPQLVIRLPLSGGPACWADTLTAVARDHQSCQPAVLNLIEKTDFNLERSLDALYALYGV